MRNDSAEIFSVPAKHIDKVYKKKASVGPNDQPSGFLNNFSFEPNYITSDNSKSSSDSVESNEDCCPNGIDPGPRWNGSR
ncbi:hypothetical protein FlaCF_2874 [Flavobacterium tructae]